MTSGAPRRRWRATTRRWRSTPTLPRRSAIAAWRSSTSSAPEEALASYDKALAVAPDHSYAFRGLADCAIKLCDWTRSQEILHELSAHVMEQRSIIAPLTLLGYCSDPSLQ